ncbi:MAG: cyclic nucleotide-binding domain-containing protein [Nitrospirae bacterium]|nr:cyclic nucleotide-binding domain-containing protein [Nitrospirota bacterium]
MKEGELGRTYASGEIIFSEGEKGEVMYVIQAGKVNIMKNTPSGELTLATLDSGDIFGEMALFDKMPRSATAKALGNARILSIDKKKLFSTISHDPTLVFKMLETMSKRIRLLNEELSKLKKTKSALVNLCCDVDEVCSMILEEARKTVQADNGSVMLVNDDSALAITAAFGKKSEQRVLMKSGHGIAGDVLRTGRAEMVNNVSMDARFVQGKVQIRSMLCVPLKCNNNILGVINMSNTSERMFGMDDLKAISNIAMYAAIAVQNAVNLANLKNAAEEVLKHAAIVG